MAPIIPTALQHPSLLIKNLQILVTSSSNPQVELLSSHDPNPQSRPHLKRVQRVALIVVHLVALPFSALIATLLHVVHQLNRHVTPLLRSLLSPIAADPLTPQRRAQETKPQASHETPAAEQQVVLTSPSAEQCLPEAEASALSQATQQPSIQEGACSRVQPVEQSSDRSLVATTKRSAQLTSPEKPTTPSHLSLKGKSPQPSQMLSIASRVTHLESNLQTSQSTSVDPSSSQDTTVHSQHTEARALEAPKSSSAAKRSPPSFSPSPSPSLLDAAANPTSHNLLALHAPSSSPRGRSMKRRAEPEIIALDDLLYDCSPERSSHLTISELLAEPTGESRVATGREGEGLSSEHDSQTTPSSTASSSVAYSPGNALSSLSEACSSVSSTVANWAQQIPTDKVWNLCEKGIALTREAREAACKMMQEPEVLEHFYQSICQELFPQEAASNAAGSWQSLFEKRLKQLRRTFAELQQEKLSYHPEHLQICYKLYTQTSLIHILNRILKEKGLFQDLDCHQPFAEQLVIDQGELARRLKEDTGELTKGSLLRLIQDQLFDSLFQGNIPFKIADLSLGHRSISILRHALPFSSNSNSTVELSSEYRLFLHACKKEKKRVLLVSSLPTGGREKEMLDQLLLAANSEEFSNTLYFIQFPFENALTQHAQPKGLLESASTWFYGPPDIRKALCDYRATLLATVYDRDHPVTYRSESAQKPVEFLFSQSVKKHLSKELLLKAVDLAYDMAYEPSGDLTLEQRKSVMLLVFCELLKAHLLDKCEISFYSHSCSEGGRELVQLASTLIWNSVVTGDFREPVKLNELRNHLRTLTLAYGLTSRDRAQSQVDLAHYRAFAAWTEEMRPETKSDNQDIDRLIRQIRGHYRAHGIVLTKGLRFDNSDAR